MDKKTLVENVVRHIQAVGFYGQHDICWSNLNRFVREQKLTQFEVSITWDDFESSQHFFSDFVKEYAE